MTAVQKSFDVFATGANTPAAARMSVADAALQLNMTVPAQVKATLQLNGGKPLPTMSAIPANSGMPRISMNEALVAVPFIAAANIVSPGNKVKAAKGVATTYEKYMANVAATGKKLDAENPFLNPVYGNLDTNARHLQRFLKDNKVAPSDMLTVVEAGLKRGTSGLYNYIHPRNPSIIRPVTNKAHIQTGVKYKVAPQSVKEMRSDNKMYNQTRAENALRREESARFGKVVKTTATVVGSAAVGYGAAKLQEK